MESLVPVQFFGNDRTRLMSEQISPDARTAQRFAKSWLSLPSGSVYTYEQFADWMDPLGRNDIANKSVLEMGCGNGSLLLHTASWHPSRLTGIDLGDSVLAATRNLETTEFQNWSVEQADLMSYSSEEPFDIVYCIGVLHHLASPKEGFRRVVANTRPGGKFHCWVYAKEGNLAVRLLVEPLRRLFSRLPWWITKYLAATPLAVGVFLYAKSFVKTHGVFPFVRYLPLSEYFLWIGRREFSFFRHVVFDQLVTPTTHYISREDVEDWIRNQPEIDQHSAYIVRRNGNSWKFGGTLIIKSERPDEVQP